MTIYYVKNGGNDLADGLSELNAWETLNKANAEFSNLNAGDTISFNRGDTFTPLSQKSDWRTPVGAEANPIIITAHGTGELPILLLDAVSALFHITPGANAGGVHFSFLQFSSLDIYDSNRCIQSIAAVHNVTITDCKFIDVLAAVNISVNEVSSNWTITSNHFENCGASGVGGGASTLLVDNNYFLNCGWFRDTYDHTVYIRGHYGYPTIGMTVSNNTFENNCFNEGNSSATIVVHGETEELTIVDNYFKEPYGSCNPAAYAIDVSAGYTTFEKISNVLIARNIMDDTGLIGIRVNTVDGCLIEKNIIRHNGSSVNVKGISVHLVSGEFVTNDVTVRDNLIYCSDSTDNLTPVEIEAGVTNSSEVDNTVVRYPTLPLMQITRLPVEGIVVPDVDGGFVYTNKTGTPPFTDTFSYIINDSSSVVSDATQGSNEAVVTLDITV